VRRFIISVEIILASILQSGCAAQGPAWQPAQTPAGGNATIYVYRPYSVAGWAVQPTVSCHDSEATIAPGGYHVFEVRPGPVRCHAETLNSSGVEINAAPGGVYYIKEQIGWGIIVGSPHLYQMETPADVDKARAEIQSCSLQ
jgi:hypothetical protein